MASGLYAMTQSFVHDALAQDKEAALLLLEEDTLRVKVQNGFGDNKWRKVHLEEGVWEGIEEDDVILLKSGWPMTMKTKPGRKLNSSKPPKAPVVLKIVNSQKKQKVHVSKDPFLQALEERALQEPGNLLLLLIRKFAKEVASLEFAVKQAELQGQSTHQLIAQRLVALRELSSLCCKFPELLTPPAVEKETPPTPTGLWTADTIAKYRRPAHDLMAVLPTLERIVVTVDPSVTANPTSSEAGIIVFGVDAAKHGYVLADASGIMVPSVWAQTAVNLYHQFRADRIVAEVNMGGDLVEEAIRNVDETVAYAAVRAYRDKFLRAEPVADLYERGFVHHVGIFQLLERQQRTWVPGTKSPDRLDALVWASTYTQLTTP